METTIRKTVKGATMKAIFDSPELINIRHYRAENFKEKDDKEDSVYLYEINVRHNDNENPKELLANAIKNIEK